MKTFKVGYTDAVFLARLGFWPCPREWSGAPHVLVEPRRGPYVSCLEDALGELLGYSNDWRLGTR